MEAALALLLLARCLRASSASDSGQGDCTQAAMLRTYLIQMTSSSKGKLASVVAGKAHPSENTLRMRLLRACARESLAKTPSNRLP
ncbi:hypothetical protein T492DRAFT_869281 [Pavlovales sp. CCMP2436]|nr:hypothetical protein T492DRAFT_869281 [Pavlovales sp. CCMP2436]